MIDLIKKLVELVYYYRQDEAAGKPYWQDPAVIGLVVSLAATELAKYMGVTLDGDLQVKIVGVVTGIGAALLPHTGIKKAPPAPPSHPYPGNAAPATGQHNLSSLS